MRKQVVLVLSIVLLSVAMLAQQSRDFFKLQPSSPAIDAGVPMFVIPIMVSGTTKNIVVDDVSGYLPGQFVLIESNSKKATIVSIDSATETLTLDKYFNVVAGQRISLPFYGDAPDTGAMEFNPNDAVLAGFAIRASPPSIEVAPGTTAEYWLILRTYGGWEGKVQIGVTGLPPNATATFTPNIVYSNMTVYGRTLMRVTIPSGVPHNSYQLLITVTELN